jgi:hypothetical protein
MVPPKEGFRAYGIIGSEVNKVPFFILGQNAGSRFIVVHANMEGILGIRTIPEAADDTTSDREFARQLFFR